MPFRNFLISLLIEFGPVVTFFIGAIYIDFFTGVALLVAATVLAVLTALYRDGRLPLFSIIASSFVVVSGIATLASHDPYWVVLEYTVYNALFGIAMFVGYLRGTPALKPLFQSMFAITDRGWHILSLRWGVFFILLAIGNEFAWRAFSYDAWVYYRFFSAIVLTVFGFYQFALTRKERLPEASVWGLRVYPTAEVTAKGSGN